MPDKTFVSQEEYVDTVLVAYISLPDTPNRARRDDRYLAIKLYRQAIELLQVKAAMLLATARRYFREPNADPLEPIRSLRYFIPVIEEIQRNEEIQRSGVMELYVDYLEQKLSSVLVMKFSNKPAAPWGASRGELHPTK